MNSRRSFIKMAAAGAATAALARGVRASGGQTAAPRNFVLVHGAWHGAWCWRRVIDRLVKAGHRVFAPTLTGLGERRHLMSREITLETHYQDVIGLIESEELGDVILVGHSFGGIVISGVAEKIPQRIGRLVYVDGVLLESGGSLLSQVVPPEVAAARRKLAEEFSGGLSLPPPKASALGIGDPADQAWVERRMTPQPFATFTEAVHREHSLGNNLPRTYIDCMDPVYQPLAAMKARYRGRADWPFVGIKSGHDAMVIAPDELTRVLLEFA